VIKLLKSGIYNKALRGRAFSVKKDKHCFAELY